MFGGGGRAALSLCISNWYRALFVRFYTLPESCEGCCNFLDYSECAFTTGNWRSAFDIGAKWTS